MESLPTLQSLHQALVSENAVEAEDELLSVITHLIVCAIGKWIYFLFYFCISLKTPQNKIRKEIIVFIQLKFHEKIDKKKDS